MKKSIIEIIIKLKAPLYDAKLKNKIFKRKHKETLHKGIRQGFNSLQGNQTVRKNLRERIGPKADNRWTIYFFTQILLSYTKPDAEPN